MCLMVRGGLNHACITSRFCRLSREPNSRTTVVRWEQLSEHRDWFFTMKKKSTKRIVQFLQAAGAQGYTSVAAAVVSSAIAVVEHLRDKNIAGYSFAVFAVLAFCYGAFRAWLTERVSLEEKTADLDLFRNEADISVEIVKGYLSNSLPREIMLGVRVVNRTDCSVTIPQVNLEIIKDGKLIPFFGRFNATKPDARFLVKEIFAGEDIRRRIHTRPTHDLFDSLVDTPLERGMHRYGEMIFTFDPSIKIDNAERFRLTFTDALGKQHQTEQDVTLTENVWWS